MDNVFYVKNDMSEKWVTTEMTTNNYWIIYGRWDGAPTPNTFG